MSKNYYFALITSLFATIASIYFIEISGNPAATLCWFERMLMFGVLLILTVGIIKKDLNLKYYALPFLILGIISASYQQLVHAGIITITPQACNIAFVCSTKFFEFYNFITQATLCLTAFVIIALCLFKFSKK